MDGFRLAQCRNNDPLSSYDGSHAPQLADRIAATWYNTGTSTIDINAGDAQVHQVGLCVVTGRMPRAARPSRRFDPAPGTVLDTRNVTAFSGGEYCVWQ